MKIWIRIVLTVCIGASLFLFIRATDFHKVVSSIEQIGYQFIFLLLITFTAYFFGTLSWQYCMGKSSRNVSPGRLFLIRHIGETVSLINPASIVVGETVKVFLLRGQGVEKKTAIASILVSRTVMIITQLVLFTTAVMIAATDHHMLKLEYNQESIFLIILIVTVLTALLVLFRQQIIKIVIKTKAGTWLKNQTTAWGSKIKEIKTEIHYLLLQHRRQLFIATMFAAVHWLIGSLEFFFILKFLGVKITVIKAIIVDMGVIFFKSAGAFIPGQIGIEEYGNKIMLAAIGIPGTEIWVTASILRRARQLFWIAVGIAIYWLLFKKRKIESRNGNTVCHP